MCVIFFRLSVCFVFFLLFLDSPVFYFIVPLSRSGLSTSLFLRLCFTLPFLAFPCELFPSSLVYILAFKPFELQDSVLCPILSVVLFGVHLLRVFLEKCGLVFLSWFVVHAESDHVVSGSVVWDTEKDRGS